ncbi:MAG: resuscitation-promoting factor RpfB [Acidimicrobiaceae bacterium]
MRLRERIHLGIALHAAVNLGFALAVMMSAVPVEVASASPIAPDPSPALERAAAVHDAESAIAVVPVTAASSARTSGVRRLRSPSTLSDNGLDRFDRLAMCESGGDPTAVSPGGRYRGAFQFSRPTWSAAGGTGDPIDVSYAEQKRVAMGWAQVVEPSTQWPVCWPRTA